MIPPFILLLSQNYIADIVIKNGARVNAKTYNGQWTPLHIATGQV